MFKRLAVLGILLAAACGSGPDSKDSAALNPSWPQGGTVRSAALTSASTSMKFVLKARTSTPTFSPVYKDDGEGGRATISCTGTTDTSCSTYGATCQAVGLAYLCGVVGASNVDSIFLVQNSLGQILTSVNVPCDSSTDPNAGVQYIAEIYGASGAVTDTNGVIKNATLQLREAYRSEPFRVNQGTNCTATPQWNVQPTTAAPNTNPFKWPSPAFPKIYQVGLPSPYDKYTVTLKNASYPWDGTFFLTNNCTDASTCTWPTVNNVEQSFNGGVSYSAPSTAATLYFQARLHLSSAVLTTEDIANGRVWEVFLSGGTLTTNPRLPSVPALTVSDFSATPIAVVPITTPG